MTYGRESKPVALWAAVDASSASMRGVHVLPRHEPVPAPLTLWSSLTDWIPRAMC
jgi:hypothetical protein